ncbi:MAG TPA: hypothetical protein PL123_14790 [Bacteroidales bacterium]|jgi:hypothetical protein|nr:hypothetical protein [Bacteroidales bacterium]
MKILDSYFSLKKNELLLGIIAVNLILLWLSRSVLINETVFFNTYSEQMTYERSMELFKKIREFSWISYLLTPLILIIKFSVLSLVVYIGFFISGFHKEVSLGSIFTVVVASEIVIVFASLTKFLWFAFFAGNYTLDEMNFFYPLSLINLFTQTEVAKYWIYPLQSVNLFQIAYILMLAIGFAKVSSVKREKSDVIVLVTYGSALILWIAFIMFLTIDIYS